MFSSAQKPAKIPPRSLAERLLWIEIRGRMLVEASEWAASIGEPELSQRLAGCAAELRKIYKMEKERAAQQRAISVTAREPGTG